MAAGRRLLVATVVMALLMGGSAPVQAAEPSTGLQELVVPTRVRIGAERTPLPMTVVGTAPGELVSVDLLAVPGGLVRSQWTTATREGRPEQYDISFGLHVSELVSWGPHRWLVAGWGRTPDGEQVDVRATVDAVVRAHSMLGLRPARAGRGVLVEGSLRAYHSVEMRYVAWSGRPVSVQVRTGSTWTQVGSAVTDGRGNLSARVDAPRGAEVRLVALDSSSVWGAVSAVAVV